MKKIIVIALVLLVGAVANNTFAQKDTNKVVCFKSNMDCTNCEKTLTDHLKFEKGVKDLKVDHVSNTILIEFKDGKNSDEGFAKSIQKKGYKADKITREEYEKIVGHTHESGHEDGTEVQIEKK